MGKRIALVAAYGKNRVIGRDGQMPWHLRSDFAHFKAVTMGHTMIMGRATWDSIGRPLPGRRTIVVTRDREWTAGAYADQVLVAHSVEEALELASGLDGDIMVVGGGQIYEQTLPLATHLILTEVDLEPQGDAYFPEVDWTAWTLTDERVGEGLRWTWWVRTSAVS